IENGADAHGDGVHRHVLPALEEPRVVIDGLFGQRLEPRARAQRARRLVEGDVAVGADAQDLQVDPAAFRDTLLVPFAEGGVVTGRPGGNIDVLPRDVHVLEEVLVHEVVVALRVTRRQAHVLVEIERGHAREVELLLLVQSHQLLIQAQGRGPRRYAAPSAVVSVTLGRTTGTPSRCDWNCISRLFADAPPSTRSSFSLILASASIARSTSAT